MNNEIKSIKDMNLKKDWKDFHDVFTSYDGLTPSTISNADIVQWMVAVTEELKRINQKIFFITEELK